MHDEGLRLVATEPAMEPNQFLERSALIGFGIVEAVHQDIRTVREAICSAQVTSGIGSELLQRVRAFHPVVLEIVGAAIAEDNRSILL